VKNLAPLGDLETLALAGTKVTTSGLRDLAAFRHLHSLDLTGIAVTSAEVEALAGCKSLRCLYLSGSVSPPLLSELRSSLPLCKIILPES
jgi:hypothetical protein